MNENSTTQTVNPNRSCLLHIVDHGTWKCLVLDVLTCSTFCGIGNCGSHVIRGMR